MTSPTPGPTGWTLAVVRVALAFAWLLAIGVVLTGTIAASPLRPSFPVRLNLLTVAPEGWAFFTRDPREPVVVVHAPAGGGGWRALELANFQRANLFGLRRTSRLVTTEVTELLREVSPEDWIPCRAPVAECLEESLPPVHTAERSSPLLPALCGPLAIQVRERVPWAWSGSRDRIQMPAKVVRLDVRCT